MTTFEPLTPERRRAMTRQHLLEAAAMVFARDGFQGSSLDDIAATAGFTKGAVYSNFKNKDDLFLAVLEEHFECQHAAMRRALEPGTDSQEVWMPRIASAVREAMWDDNWAMLFLEFVLYAARNPQARSKLADWMHRSLRRVEQLIAQEYDAAGAPPPYPPADLAIISGSLFDGLGLYRLIDPSLTNDHTLKAVLEFMSDAFGIDQDATESGQAQKPVADAP
ncbi:MAG: TetR family transcriptional regulator [Acidimicrobiia bacterium]